MSVMFCEALYISTTRENVFCSLPRFTLEEKEEKQENEAWNCPLENQDFFLFFIFFLLLVAHIAHFVGQGNGKCSKQLEALYSRQLCQREYIFSSNTAGMGVSRIQLYKCLKCVLLYQQYLSKLCKYTANPTHFQSELHRLS